MKRFLINKTSSIGDVIQTLPVLAYLKERYPDSQVDWIVEKNCTSFLKSIPLINKVIEVDTKQWRCSIFDKQTRRDFSKVKSTLQSIEYDTVFDLQGNIKSSLWTYFALSRHKVGFAYRDCPEWPNLLVTNYKFSAPKGFMQNRYLGVVKSFFLDEGEFTFKGMEIIPPQNEEEVIQDYFKEHALTERDVVLVTPFSRWQNKEMKDEALAKLLVRASEEAPVSFLITVSNDVEKKRALQMLDIFPQLFIIESTSLTMWMAIMKKCKMVLSVDSAGLHLAAALGIPTFSLFGPSSEQVYRPIGSMHLSFQGRCPYSMRFEKRCPKLRTCPTGACMKDMEYGLWERTFLKSLKAATHKF